MIMPGETYTDGLDVYRAVEIQQPISALMLVNLNRSAKWQTVVGTNPLKFSSYRNGYADGYIVSGNSLKQYSFCFGFNQKTRLMDYTEVESGMPPCRLTTFKPCDVEAVKVDLSEWGPRV